MQEFKEALYGWQKIKGNHQQYERWTTSARAKKHVICAIPFHVVNLMTEEASVQKSALLHFCDDGDIRLILEKNASVTLLLQKCGQKYDMHVHVNSKGQLQIERIGGGCRSYGENSHSASSASS
ncbi:MAG: hypothetical protein WC819_05755 [Parcubacteria group bacterium]|jgi:hypothetical protein